MTLPRLVEADRGVTLALFVSDATLRMRDILVIRHGRVRGRREDASSSYIGELPLTSPGIHKAEILR